MAQKVPTADFIRRQEVAAVLSKYTKLCVRRTLRLQGKCLRLYQGVVLEVPKDDEDEDEYDSNCNFSVLLAMRDQKC